MMLITLLITVRFAYSTQVGERRVDWLGLLLYLEREQQSLKGWNCRFPKRLSSFMTLIKFKF